MEYATNHFSIEQAECADRPYLARIGELADEAGRIATNIDSFLNRCRGGGNTEAKTGPEPVPSGHLGQLDRLQNNIGRVDKLARELQRIG